MADQLPSPMRTPMQWWSFDAVSDDGTEIVSIRFYNSHLFSVNNQRLLPAVSFIYHSKGQQTCRAVCEFPEDSLRSSDGGLSIADNSVRHEEAAYGNGWVIDVDLRLRGQRRVLATFEWLSLNAEYERGATVTSSGCGDWFIESPRSDVSGRVTLARGSKTDKTCHFRGTGSYTRYSSDVQSGTPFGARMSGIAFFGEEELFFCKEGSVLRESPHAALSIVAEGGHSTGKVRSLEQSWSRTRYGIAYPAHLTLSDENRRIGVSLLAPYESELCFARFPAEFTFDSDADSKTRQAIGVVEVLEPRRLKSNVIRWFSSLTVRSEARPVSEVPR